MIRNALQFAEFSSQSNSVVAGRSLSVSVDPSTFKSSSDLKHLKDETRACWFYNEVRVVGRVVRLSMLIIINLSDVLGKFEMD